jgi:hypothetical protein
LPTIFPPLLPLQATGFIITTATLAITRFKPMAWEKRGCALMDHQAVRLWRMGVLL